MPTVETLHTLLTLLGTQQCSMELNEAQALSCCASPRWARQMAGKQFSDLAQLVSAARHVWWKECPVTEWLAAFSAHPKIGAKHEGTDVGSLFAAFSNSEQAASASTLAVGVEEELVVLNQNYLERHGFIFIICAKGRPAPEILSALKARIDRAPHEELVTAAQEQVSALNLLPHRMCPRFALPSIAQPH